MRRVAFCFEGFPIDHRYIHICRRSEPNNRRSFKSDLMQVNVQHPPTPQFDTEYFQVKEYGMTFPARRKARTHSCYCMEINSAASIVSLPLQAGFSIKHLPPFFSLIDDLCPRKNPKACFTCHLTLAECEQFQLSGILAVLKATEAFQDETGQANPKLPSNYPH